MLFVLQGKLQMYSFSSSASCTARRGAIRYIPRVHENGDFCGEELVAWFQVDPYSSNLPISTRTIRAVTRVEGFDLMSEDLTVVLIEHSKALFIQSYRRTKMMLRSTRNVTNNTASYGSFPPRILASTGSAKNVHRESRKDLLKEGDFCSEELVDWVQDEPFSIHPTNLFRTQAFKQLQKLKLLFLGLMT
ncbi:hypothetical protein JRO89_XS11G0217700 [Xanthoceras sorbifolium]|uniref:Cyclic nucleotide-binding domain-containing protein n=1 Tax=Xanthoceras sorbifolium TaxID=99658 RepID=A0ABQ8HGK2_9ROSI|nr:hypothetical protein JRO89_XS11G0217700 [Xanthoceras sorbifolium]